MNSTTLGTAEIVPETPQAATAASPPNEGVGNISTTTIPPLKVFSSTYLAEVILPKPQYVVDELIGPGLSMLVGNPKEGKSLLILLLASCVANGTPFLGRKTITGGVLYCALEDTEIRLQSRQDIMELQPTDNLRFTTEVPTLDNGFCDVIREHVRMYPATKLVIVDTLQFLRGETNSSNIYKIDFNEMMVIKKLCAELEINIIVVHHTNKDETKEGLDRAAGSHGITGTVDTVLLLQRDKKNKKKSTIEVWGKDVPSEIINLTFDKKKLLHYPNDETQNQEEEKKELPELLEAFCRAVEDYGEFYGTNEQFIQWVDATTGILIEVGDFKRKVRSNYQQLVARGIEVSTPKPKTNDRYTSVKYTPPTDKT